MTVAMIRKTSMATGIPLAGRIARPRIGRRLVERLDPAQPAGRTSEPPAVGYGD